jgi:autotransporter-associated beta strand protein
MNPSKQRFVALLTLLAAAVSASAQVLIGTGGITTQTFDSMGTTQAATLPSGFRVSAAGAGTTGSWATGGTATTQQASTGSPTTGGIYNWGTSTTERALGFMTSGSYASPNSIMVQLQNNTGGVITALNSIDFDIERYRINTAAASISFFYSLDGSSWTSSSAGDIASGTIGSGASAYSFASPTVFSPTAFNITGLSLANSSSIYFRWVFNTTGASSQGLGLDNFSMGAPTFTVAGADISYGGGGTFSSSSFGGAAFTTNDTAVFGGASGSTVNLSGAVTATSLKFTTTGYTVASPTGSDSLTVSGAIDVSSAVSATISGTLAGSSGLTKTGAGALTVSGTNTFTGLVSISAGTLSISSDANLGNSANDISISGTLAATANVTLGSGRDVSGSGTIAVSSGRTLTTSGTFSMSSLTLSDSGTLALSGSSNSISALTFNAAGSVTGNSITLGGNVATTGFTGTASIANAMAFGTTARTFTTDSGASLTLSGDLTGTGSGRLQKRGAGTLTLSGSNSGLIGVQLGAQGATPSEGGTLVVTTDNALGSGQFQFNSGTLSTSSARTFTNGISIGGRSGTGVSVPSLSGSAMEFQGANGFFRATGTSGTLNLNVNNTTTLSGNFSATSGTGTATSVSLGGSGTLILKGTNTALTDAITIGDTLTVRVENATNGLGTGNVTVNSGSTLLVNSSTVSNTLSVSGRIGGIGTLAGTTAILNGGTLAPGNSPGILTNSGTLSLASGATYSWELNALSSASAGTNFDQIANTGTITIQSGALLAPLFTGSATSPSNVTYWTSPQSWVVIANSGAGSVTGTLTIDNSAWSSFGTFSTSITGLGLELAWTPSSAIPEPSTYAAIAGLFGLALAVWSRRRRQA